LTASRYSRPVPLWALLVAIILTASITAGLTILPGILSPKPDFALSLTNNPLMIFAQNQEGNSTDLIVDSVRNFTGIVSVQWTLPKGLTIGLSPTTAQILLGKTGMSVLGIAGQTVGNYTVVATASSGTIYHSATLTVRVTNLTMTPNPSSLTITRGSSGTSTISLTSVNGFDGDLYASSAAYSLDGSGIWNVPDNTIATSVTPYISTLPPDGTVQAVLNITVGQSSTVGQRQILVQMSLATVKLRMTIALTVS
jgi:hypothetical protein